MGRCTRVRSRKGGFEGVRTLDSDKQLWESVQPRVVLLTKVSLDRNPLTSRCCLNSLRNAPETHCYLEVHSVFPPTLCHVLSVFSLTRVSRQLYISRNSTGPRSYTHRSISMCRATTSLTYGVPVRTSSLIFAIDAFPRLEAPLLFFRLIALRRGKGTLSTLKSSAIERVPDEVWELVQHKVVDLELERADKRFFCEMIGEVEGHERWLDLLDLYPYGGYVNDVWEYFRAGVFEQEGRKDVRFCLPFFFGTEGVDAALV